jgi:radical SAM protein with 4Fe4S-binding SPASM domain
MRYLACSAMESYESEVLLRDFGKFYYPLGDVNMGRDTLVDAPDTVCVPVEDEMLALEPDTASWSFLTNAEGELLRRLAPGRSLGSLLDDWPGGDGGAAAAFVGNLFRRGLVRLNGQTSVQPEIFHDSANCQEGHLVELLVTEKCNLACEYCLAGANQSLPHMSEEIALKAVDLAYGMDQPSITFEFSGGEPFLRFELMRKLVGHIRDHPNRAGREVYICLQTNGTLLNEERVQWMADNSIIVGLSLDGNPDSHNLSRPQVNGKESFSKVLHGLTLMREAGVAYGILVVLNRSNIHAPERLIEFMTEHGIQQFKLNPIAFLGTARSEWDRLALGQDQILDYFQTLGRRLVSSGQDIFESNLLDMTRHLVSKQRQSRCLRGHCGAGDSFNAISADGSIYPCGRATQSPALKLGDVLTEPFALNRPGRNNLYIQRIRERRPKTLEDCVSCHYRELCQAGCAVQAFERYGTVRHKTPECSFNKAMYPHLMHWLSHDPEAVAYLNRSQYFAGRNQLHIAEQAFLAA